MLKTHSRRLLAIAAVFLILAGAGIEALAWRHTVTILIGADRRQVTTFAQTSGSALAAAGIALGAADRLSPPADAWLPDHTPVVLERAASIQIYVRNGAAADNPALIKKLLIGVEKRPANLLAQMGIRLYPGDRLFRDGQEIDPALELASGPAVLQLVQPWPVSLESDGQTRLVYGQGVVMGQVLWQAGVNILAGDVLSPPPDTLVDGLQPLPLFVSLRQARPVIIKMANQVIHALTAATTVGAALEEAGVSLVGLDFSAPGEDTPLPADRSIRVVRVREEVQLNPKEIPFETKKQADGQTELDQWREVQPGQVGLFVNRVRVRYEDGQEVSRQAEGEWQARPAQDRILGFGTKVVIHTLDTENGRIEYWRAVTMYATSYSPCNQGVGHCSYSTASGAILKKGIVAVTVPWYRYFAGTQVYVPGYGTGTIADTSGGVSWGYHIDLGYGEDDFHNWHENVTVYFLTPVPATIPWILP
jgi:resuscitation-promoting factor RpfB